MKIRIGFILELPGHVPAVRLGKLDGLVDHADRPLGGGSYDDFRAKEPHQLPPLDAEWFRHGDHKRVPLGGADHGKTDPGISACRLYDRLAGLKLSRFFVRLHYPKSQSILELTKRLESFDVYEKVHALRRQTIDPHYRRVADGFDDILVFPAHGPSQRCDEKYCAPAAPLWIASKLTRIWLLRQCRGEWPTLGHCT